MRPAQPQQPGTGAVGELEGEDFGVRERRVGDTLGDMGERTPGGALLAGEDGEVMNRMAEGEVGRGEEFTKYLAQDDSRYAPPEPTVLVVEGNGEDQPHALTVVRGHGIVAGVVAGDDLGAADGGVCEAGEGLLGRVVFLEPGKLALYQAVLVDFDLVNGGVGFFLILRLAGGAADDQLVEHERRFLEAAGLGVDGVRIEVERDEVNLGEGHPGRQIVVDFLHCDAGVGVEISTMTLQGAHSGEAGDGAQVLVDGGENGIDPSCRLASLGVLLHPVVHQVVAPLHLEPAVHQPDEQEGEEQEGRAEQAVL